MAGALPELYREAFQEMFDAAAPIVEFGTAFEAESAISVLLGGVYQKVVAEDLRGVLTTFVDDFVKYLQRRRTPQSMAILAGLSAVAPGVGGERAGKAIQRFTDREIDGPRWVSQVGKVQPTTAVVFKDIYGDQSQYVITYHYDAPEIGGEDHAVAVVVDHNKRLVTDIAVAPAAQLLPRLQESVAEAAGYLTVDPVNPALARVQAERHLVRTEQLVRNPDQMFLDNWALVCARLALLPDSPEALEVLEAKSALDDEARDEVVAEFLKSDVARLLARQMTPRVLVPFDVVRPAARYAVDYAVDVNSGDPLRWSPAAVRDMLLNWAPQQTDMPTDVRSWLPEVLDAFSLYAGMKRGLPENALMANRFAVGESTEEYTKRMLGDPDGESMDAVLQQMIADGVDPSDEEASRRWLADYLEKQQRGAAPPTDTGSAPGSGGSQ